MGTFVHDELRRHPDKVGLGGPFQGAIVAPLPTVLRDPVYVQVLAWNPVTATVKSPSAQTFGPCRWQSRDASSLPAAGDLCLLIFDDAGEPWVTAWWPFT